MILKDLLTVLDDGATKLNIISAENGEVFYRGIWFCDMDKSLYNKEIQKIIVEDYLLNIFL